LFFFSQFTVNIMMAMLLLFLGIYLYETKKSSAASVLPSSAAAAADAPLRKDQLTRLSSTLRQIREKIRRNMGVR
jgi:hypothetical protein